MAGYMLIIYDNSPSFTKKCNVKLPLGYGNFHYLSGGKNFGIMIAFAHIFTYATYSNFEYILYFDQDSVLDLTTLDYCNNILNQNKNELNNYGIISMYLHNNINNNLTLLESNKLIISSGSIFNLMVLDKINWYSNFYSIDCADYKICLELKKAGYKIGLLPQAPGFDHISRQANLEVKNILGITLKLKKFEIY